MYDFSKQKEMLDVTIDLLEQNDLLECSSLGGGTALAAYYFNHRYSTDIDIFIYDTTNKTHLLKPSSWNTLINKKFEKIGFTGNFRHNDIYTEIVINQDSKIQFFDVIKKSKEPYKKVNLWGHNLNIDSIEEIIAKKIHYRGDIGNSRDLFDIAITILNISNTPELKDLYSYEIKLMKPNNKYEFLAVNTIPYLKNILENICASYEINYELSNDEFILIENEIYNDLKI